jgi:hypothetical protein
MAADVIGVDLDQTTEALYTDLDAIGCEYEVDYTDPANPVVMVGGCQLPVGKDYLITPHGRTFQLPGVTVLAAQGNNYDKYGDLLAEPVLEDDKVYISRNAARILCWF